MRKGDARPIAREHLHGATVWAYGGGCAHVKPWVRLHQFSRFGGVRDAEIVDGLTVVLPRRGVALVW